MVHVDGDGKPHKIKWTTGVQQGNFSSNYEHGIGQEVAIARVRERLKRYGVDEKLFADDLRVPAKNGMRVKCEEHPEIAPFKQGAKDMPFPVANILTLRYHLNEIGLSIS